MNIQIPDEWKKLINAPDTLKVLATVDSDGVPHVVFKDSIIVNEDGYVEYLELLESSQTNKNMTYSIWFNKTVAVSVYSGGRSFQIKGTPYRELITGREFEKRYITVKEKQGEDLAAVWLIEPYQIKEQTYEVRKAAEEKAHPLLRHLDMITEKP